MEKACIVLGLTVTATFFAVTAFGHLDGDQAVCFGQTIVSGVYKKRKVVTDYKVDGMGNHDVAQDFHRWFIFGLLIFLLLPGLIYVLRKRTGVFFFSGTLFFSWLVFGILWRFSEWGE